jgi:hypothetical protein
MLLTIPAPVRRRPRPRSAKSGSSLAAAGDFALGCRVSATPRGTTVPAAEGSVVTWAQERTGLPAMLRRSAM